MKRFELMPSGTLQVPIFSDSEGNQYIAIAVPKEMQAELGTTIYQPISVNMEPETTMQWHGVSVELYQTSLFENKIALHLDEEHYLLGKDVDITQ